MSTIQVDKEELRGIIREAVQKKLASLKEDKHTAATVTQTRKRPSLTEAQRLEKAREALKALQEAIGHTSAGSLLGPAGGAGLDGGMKDEAMGGGVPGPMTGTPKLEAGRATVADSAAADELHLWMVNTGSIWDNKQNTPEVRLKRGIMKNLALKMKKGKYDSSLAPKLWMSLVTAAAKKYVDKYGDGPDARVDTLFNKATRLLVAQELAANFEEKIRGGEFNLDNLIAMT